jgi:hypothetical protein
VRVTRDSGMSFFSVWTLLEKNMNHIKVIGKAIGAKTNVFFTHTIMYLGSFIYLV